MPTPLAMSADDLDQAHYPQGGPRPTRSQIPRTQGIPTPYSLDPETETLDPEGFKGFGS